MLKKKYRSDFYDIYFPETRFLFNTRGINAAEKVTPGIIYLRKSRLRQRLP